MILDFGEVHSAGRGVGQRQALRNASLGAISVRRFRRSAAGRESDSRALANLPGASYGLEQKQGLYGPVRLRERSERSRAGRALVALVILIAAKDLRSIVLRHEILRCAQDDRIENLRCAQDNGLSTTNS